MHKRFLAKRPGMRLAVLGFAILGLAVLAALAVTGCETEASVSSVPEKGRTIVLSGVPAGVTVGKAEVFSASANVSTDMPVGGGAAANGGTPSSGGNVTIAIQPYSGSFSADSYQIVIEAGGERRVMSGVSLRASSASLNWENMNPIETAQYGISLRSAGGETLDTHTFTNAPAGYTEPPPALSVTVTNTGTEWTGPLTVALVQTANAFTLSTGSIADIAPGLPVVNAFSVRPVGDLPAGPYFALVEVRGANNIYRPFYVSFTVESETPGGEPVYNIVLTPIGDTNLTMVEGGEIPPDLDVTVRNNGEQATGALSVVLVGNNYNAFTLSTGSIADIAPNGGTATFSVQPNGRLTTGDYTAMVVVRKGEDNTLAYLGVRLTVVKKEYKISLSPTGTMVFKAQVSYSPVQPETVTITNSGNVPTGTLKVALDGTDKDSFIVTQPNPSSITATNGKGTATFTVVPNNGLGNGTYNATVTVSESNGISESFDVTFSVEGEHSISLDESGIHDFGSLVVGYTAADLTKKTKVVTITSEGMVPTGDLKVELSGVHTGSFKLSYGKTPLTEVASAITIPTIKDGGGEDYFNVVPITGLPAGDYSAIVTVSAVDNGSDIAPKSFTVSFTVKAQQHKISLQSGDIDFKSKIEGYTVQPEDTTTVTISNVGNVPTGPLTVTLDGTGKDSFTVTQPNPNSITATDGTGTATFTVRPTTGLPAGDYTATVTVGGTNIEEEKTFTVSFTVDAKKYEISLSGLDANGNIGFGSKILGYTEQDLPLKTVTITNDSNSNVETGMLTVALEGDTSAFTVSRTTIPSIAVGETATFTVVPNTGLTVAKTYTATVTVGGTNFTEADKKKTFIVSFTVAIPSIGFVDENGMNNNVLTIEEVLGYTEQQTTRRVTIRNEGSVETGDLQVVVLNSSDFVITPGHIDSILSTGIREGTFAIAPRSGLGVGKHIKTVSIMHGTATLLSFTVNFTVTPPPAYGIRLSHTGTYPFEARTLYYPPPAPLLVTITNMGTGETGTLGVELSGTDSGSFTHSPAIIPSIGVGNSNSFTVQPNDNLTVAKTYTATVTVKGRTEIEEKSFTVSFTVNPGPDPSYEIILDKSGTHSFGTVTVPYTQPAPLSVTITNTGTGPTGDLAVSFINNTAFDVATADGNDYHSSINIGSIPINQSGSFWVRPRQGITAANTYTATVTVGPAFSNNTGITSKTLNVSFTVNPAPQVTPDIYSIALSQTEPMVFDTVDAGYGARTARQVAIINTGNQPTGALTVSLNNTDFEVATVINGTYNTSSITINSIPINQSGSFWVRPRTGLSATTHNATVTVGGSNIAPADWQTLYVIFPVNESNVPNYRISLSNVNDGSVLDTNHGHTFAAVRRPYAQPAGLNVRITNVGNVSTGNLTLTLSNSTAFTLSTTSINTILAGNSDYFLVTPKTDLAANTYPATVTVSNGGSGNQELSAVFGVSLEVQSAFTYDISLRNESDQSLDDATYNFESATEGYGAPTPLEVTIRNIGTGVTGALTVSAGAGSGFVVASTRNGTYSTSISIDSIPSQQARYFYVRPQTDLGAATHTANVTVWGGNIPDANWKTFTVGFTVSDDGPAPTYGIVFSPDRLEWTLEEASAGYTTQPSQEVTITNTGTGPTGGLTVSLSSNTYFEVARTGGTYGALTTISNLTSGQSASFRLRARSGLTPNTDPYTATVTVSNGLSGAQGILETSTVSFTVTDTYGISLSREGNNVLDATHGHTFGAVTLPTYNQPVLSVTITNTGTGETGNLTVAIGGTNQGAFSFTPPVPLNITATNGTATFTVMPNGNLGAGTYTATVTVSGSHGISRSFDVSFTVNPAPDYRISLNPETWEFPQAPWGYGAQPGKSVAVTNTGNRATGPLALVLSNSTAFTLSKTSINDIAVGGSTSFIVTPKTGLTANTYNGKVTVSGGNGIVAKEFSFSFRVVTPINISANTNTMPDIPTAIRPVFIDDTDGHGKVLSFTESGDYTSWPVTSLGQATPTRIQVAAGKTVSLTFIDVKIGYALPANSPNENTGSALDIGAGSTVNITLRGINEVSGLSNPGAYNDIYLYDKPSINMAAGSILNITSASTGSLKAFYSTWQPGIGGTLNIPFGAWDVATSLIPANNGTVNINGGAVNVATRPGPFVGAENLPSPNITSNVIINGGTLTPLPSGGWLSETPPGSGIWTRN